MSFAGDHMTAVGASGRGSLALGGLDWDKALSLAETLARVPGGRNALSFLDEALIVRCIVDRNERKLVSRHLLLPALGRLSRTLLRLTGFHDMATTAFRPADFIKGFLTFAEQPLRILVVAETSDGAQSLAEQLKAHAPWHDFVSGQTGDRCDVMIISDADRRWGRALACEAGCAANLVIHAGRLY